MYNKIFICLFLCVFLSGYSNSYSQKILKEVREYSVISHSRENLSAITEFDKTGLKIKRTDYEYGKKISALTTYFYNKNNRIEKEIIVWSNFDDTTSYCTLNYKYDEKGRLKEQKYEGDYATDVSPDLFEFIYDEKGLLVEKKHIVTAYPDNPRKLEMVTKYKYDKQGLKIEEVTSALDFEYNIKGKFSYDDDGDLVKTVFGEDYGEKSTTRFEYIYW